MADSDDPGFHDAPTDIGSDAEPEAAATATTPRVLAGRYVLEEPIASGGAATVWRAFDVTLSRSVAIKLLHPHLSGEGKTVERFRLESVNAARISHPNAVAIYDTGQEADDVYLVMEYVDGPSLRDVLVDQGPLDPTIVAAIGEQVATALAEAHAAGIIHRDIKPANILMTSDGVAKVTDFGIAKALSGVQETLTGPGTVVGTAAYVAPEQLEGQEVDARVDVFALGVVLYECLIGKPAFSGDTPTATAAARLTRELLPPRQLRADVPRALDEVVVRCTRRDPNLRFGNAAEVAAALAPLVRARPADVTATLLQADRHVEPGLEKLRDVDTDRLTTPRRELQPRTRTLLGIAAAAVAAVAVFLLLQALDEGPVEPDPVEGMLQPVMQAGDFDPFGQPPEEHPEDVRLAYDGDLTTAWETENYRNDPVFGGLKAGVGVWFDLGQRIALEEVVLDLTTSGIDLELYATDELPDSIDGLVGWGQPQATFDGVPAEVSLQLPETPVGRFWLVWITELAPTEEGLYRAGLSEIRFLGEPL